MGQSISRELTLQALRDRREQLLLELSLLEGTPALSAREFLTWRTRIAELEARIARWSHEART